jgi:uncharacterized protein YkwD
MHHRDTETRRRKPRNLSPCLRVSVVIFLLSGPLFQAFAQLPCPALESGWDKGLCQLAQEAANTMASNGTCGHPNFQSRFERAQAMGYGNVQEIAAQSWQWEAAAGYWELWQSAVESWKHSPGHWKTACRRHRAVGCAMAQGRDGTWFFCILAGD